MNLYNIFPTTVGMFELDRELTKAEIDFVLKQEKRPNQGNTTSVDNYILRKKQLKGLNKFIEDSVNTYFQQIYAPKTDVELYVTQSWLNFSEKGQFHHKHAHPNSFLSGVFYIEADPTKDKIYFFKEGYSQIKFEPKEWNLSNSDSWWFEVATKKMVVFPSSLTHMVQTVEAENTRISLAFNTFFKGTCGLNENLTELILGDKV